MTKVTRKRARYVQFLLVFLFVSAVAFISSWRPSRCRPALLQQPDSIAVRIRNLGSDRFLWLVPSGESTSVTFRRDGFLRPKRGNLTQTQWRSLLEAVPTDFFEQDEEHFLKTLHPDVAYEGFSGCLSIRIGEKGRTLWIHPSHLQDGVFKEFYATLQSIEEALKSAEPTSVGYLLAIELDGYSFESPPSSLATLLGEASRTPCKWFSATNEPGEEPKVSSSPRRYTVERCGYLFLTGSSGMRDGIGHSSDKREN